MIFSQTYLDQKYSFLSQEHLLGAIPFLFWNDTVTNVHNYTLFPPKFLNCWLQSNNKILQHLFLFIYFIVAMSISVKFISA